MSTATHFDGTAGRYTVTHDQRGTLGDVRRDSTGRNLWHAYSTAGALIGAEFPTRAKAAAYLLEQARPAEPQADAAPATPRTLTARGAVLAALAAAGITADRRDVRPPFTGPDIVALSLPYDLGAQVDTLDVLQAAGFTATQHAGRLYRVTRAPEPTPAELDALAVRVLALAAHGLWDAAVTAERTRRARAALLADDHGAAADTEDDEHGTGHEPGSRPHVCPLCAEDAGDPFGLFTYRDPAETVGTLMVLVESAEDDATAESEHGRCDTCGATCTAAGCAVDPSHLASLDVDDPRPCDRHACTYVAHDVADLAEHISLNH